jgi:hypothetical protein
MVALLDYEGVSIAKKMFFTGMLAIVFVLVLSGYETNADDDNNDDALYELAGRWYAAPPPRGGLT